MSDLKPCPFCGGEADCNNNAVMQGGKLKWATECLGCGVITDCFDTKQEAIEAWNRRADDEKYLR